MTKSFYNYWVAAPNIHFWDYLVSDRTKLIKWYNSATANHPSTEINLFPGSTIYFGLEIYVISFEFLKFSSLEVCNSWQTFQSR